ncbi:sensor histidine kinase [Trinickia terrae]|uniref:histidine kinase n=1 Tax=Trinickia terrae TaxID=2571161 RepID=A0A4U1HJT0_9BURK|nr:ATP-binding protein [Trinickia terrae]TKC81421.1 sensor histidine kinase [Trinickia terrae]
MRHRFLPRSLRLQILIAALVLSLLIVVGGLTALYSLRTATSATRALAKDQLVTMQHAQELVQQTLLIERESAQLADAASLDAMRKSYAGIVRRLERFDALSDLLATTNNDLAILDLRQSSQLFRNTANIVAQLRESQLQALGKRVALPSADDAATDEPAPGVEDSTRRLRDEMRQEASAMAAAAQARSDQYTQEFQVAVEGLAETSERNQRWLASLLALSLLFAWLFTRVFLGDHVLNRLQQVSLSLRTSDGGETHALALDHGDDEIDEMAKAVENFQKDRRQLALTNAELHVEKLRQEKLINELAQVHSQLLQSEKMASIGQLAAGVAHEINNPVGFVNANLGTLKQYVGDLLKALAAYEASEDEMTPDTRAAMAKLKQEIDLAYLREDVGALLAESTDGLQRVRDIVQGLKDFSHVDRMEKQVACLQTNLESTVKIAWNEIKYKAELVRDYRPIPEIECIPSQLNQVFMNLLVNAAQSIEGHGSITLRTGQDPGHVWVEIEDTGKGISPEYLGRIFDPFFTTKPVGVGTGLGLSISYGIVKQHGGRIDVESELGKGSRFRVVLPVEAA